MKRIVTLVLMMLIGGYGAAQAQTPTVTEEEEATKTEEATKEFLGLKWGLGIGVMGGFGGDAAVEKASIITVGNSKIVHIEEEGELRPQMFMEMHAFLRGNTVKEWRKYQRWKAGDQMAKAKTLKTTRTKALTMPDPPVWGIGPFVALQGSENEIINALALGVMLGIRKDPADSRSVNIGVGVSFDPSVQVLAKGFKEGGNPPNDETAVRFKKEGRFGWALMASFTF